MKNFLLSILLLTPYFISAKGSRLGVGHRDLVVCPGDPPGPTCSLDTNCDDGDACTRDVCDNGCCISKAANPQCCPTFDCSTLNDACNTASCNTVDNTCKFVDRGLCTVGKCTLDAGATGGYVCSECSVDNDCEDGDRCTINYCNNRVCEEVSSCRQEGCEGTCTLVAEVPTCDFSNCVSTKCVVECTGTADDCAGRACSIVTSDTNGQIGNLGDLTCTCTDCDASEIGIGSLSCIDDTGIDISMCDNDPYEQNTCCPSASTSTENSFTCDDTCEATTTTTTTTTTTSTTFTTTTTTTEPETTTTTTPDTTTTPEATTTATTCVDVGGDCDNSEECCGRSRCKGAKGDKNGQKKCE